ncbi:MAG: hypothetical protein E3K29_06880 [Candidatus Brocadia sp.]|nr:hypothetical protein [Candidatus Brocadia sp.]
MPAVVWIPMAISAGMMMAQYAIQKFTQKPLKPGERNITASITDTRKYLSVGYGRIKQGIDIVFHAADPGNQQVYWYIGAIGVGEIEHVDALYFDNNRAASWADGQDATSAGALTPYAGFINTAAYKGKSAQNANSTIINLFPDSWDSNCTGNYVAYFLGSINLDAKVFPNGLPNDIGVVVKQLKVQDVRDGSWPNATPAYSTNPVLAILDYFVGKKDARGNKIYGHGALPGEIDTASWIAAANYCDELVGTPVSDPVPPAVKLLNESGNLTTNTKYRYKIAYRDAGGNHTAASKKSNPVTTTDKKTKVKIIVQACEASTITKIDIYRNVAGDMTTFKLAGTIDNSTSAGELIWTDSVADASLGAAAPTTNNTSSGGQQQKRFEIGGLVQNENDVKSNIEKLLTSCRGNIVYNMGKYSFFIRKAGSAVGFEITKDNIVGNWSFETPGIQPTCNQIKASFTNPKKKWDTDFVYWPDLRRNNKYLAEDAMQENERTIDLLYTTNKTTALQIAQVIRKESRQGIRCSCICNYSAIVLKYGDIVPVTYDRLGWSQKKFWVTSVDYYPNATIGIGLEEYDATCYDYETLSLDTSGSDDTDLPDINDPPDSVSNVVFLEHKNTQNADSVIDLSVTYDNPTSPFWAYSNVYWKPESDSRRVRYYKFDDNSNNYVTDCGNDRADLTLYGSAEWTTGKFNYGVLFDGTSGYASAKPVITEEVTVSFWFYRKSVNASRRDFLIYNGTAVSKSGFYIYFETNSHTLKYYLVTQTSGGTKTEQTISYNMVASLNAWHHVVCTYNINTGKQRMFINNAFAAGAGHTAGNTIVPNTNPDLLVGATVGANYINAIIDSLVIYDEILEPDEIDNLYNNRPVYLDVRKVRHYKLTEGSGTLLCDSGSDKANMTLYNGVGWGNDGGDILIFDGVNDYADATVLNNEEITLSFRFKRLAVKVGSAGYFLNNRNATDNDGYCIYFDDNSHVLKYLLVTQDSSNNKTSKTATYDMVNSTDGWHQITVTYDAFSGKQTLSIDGIARDYQMHPAGNTIVPPNRTAMQLGSGYAANYSHVQIKSFVLYSAALPDADVYNLYCFDTYYISANNYDFLTKIDKSNSNVFEVSNLQRFQTYHFKILSVNTFGVMQDFSTSVVFTHTIGDTNTMDDIDPNTINITVTTTDNVNHRIQVSWVYNINTYVSDYVRDYRHFNVAISSSNSWDGVVLSDITNTTWYSCPVSAGTWYFLVEAVDANGKTSNATTLASKAFTVTDQDGGVIVVGGGQPAWTDIITGNFTTGTKTDTERKVGPGGLYYLWLTQNQISNPSFNTNLTGWTIEKGSWVRSTARYYSSPASLKRAACNKAVSCYTELGSVIKGYKYYIFSAWVYSSSKNTDRIGLYFDYAFHDPYKKYYLYSNYHSGNSSWQRLDIRFTSDQYAPDTFYLKAMTDKASESGAFFDDFYFGVVSGGYTSLAYDRGNGAPNVSKVFKISTPTIGTDENTEGKITISVGTSADDSLYTWYSGLEVGALQITAKRYIRYRIQFSNSGPVDVLCIKDDLKLSWSDPITASVNFPAAFSWDGTLSKASVGGNIDLTSGNNVTIANTTANKNIALSTSGTGVVTVNGKNVGMNLQVFSYEFSPAKSTTYYFGASAAPARTNGAKARLYFPVSGTITLARIYSRANNVAGTGENWSLYIRRNDTTDTLIQTVGVAGADRTWVNTSLAIAVSAGDYMEIKCVTPNWATAPTDVSFSGVIYITF